MELLRTKRIRAGVIVIVVSVIVMAVVSALAEHNAEVPWLSKPLSMRRVVGSDGSRYVEWSSFRIKHIVALGLVGVGIGAVLVITGLTMPKPGGQNG